MLRNGFLKEIIFLLLLLLSSSSAPFHYCYVIFETKNDDFILVRRAFWLFLFTKNAIK